MRWPHHRYALVLAAIYMVLFIALAFNPYDRQDWLLENALAVALVAVLVASRNAFPLSRVSYTLIFAFLCLHTVGAHYTYSLVPYDDWISRVVGSGPSDWFGWERNHFDRFVHLCYGLLFAYPMREVFLRIADARGFWGYALPLDVTMSTSLIYELIEWAAALVFGGDLATTYLGTQGDPWDAQKDMALAAIGAAVAMVVVAAINIRLRRDFAREWTESLRVKRRQPLGEDRLREMAAESRRGTGVGRSRPPTGR